MIEPRMGTLSKPSGLADALFSTTQQRVLGLLFGQPDRSFYAREVIALAGEGGSGAVQRELARLERSRLITSERRGSQKYFQVNRASPLFEELNSIALKTFALTEPLRAALKPLKARIKAAFVYGSIAKRQDTASSDIDLLIISDAVDYPDVMSALQAATMQFGREVNPSIYSPQEFTRRLREGNAFVTRVMEQPKLWIIGDEDDLPA
ncbi:MAG: transcriptional regulator [Gammaproteobacteria bacterium]